MGLGDITNSLLGGAEHLYDEGKKKLGEDVDYGTDKLGGALDDVGAHDWADSVEDWGDEVASDLGATPGEQQLGQSEEPNELIHGSPDKIRESAETPEGLLRRLRQGQPGTAEGRLLGLAGRGR